MKILKTFALAVALLAIASAAGCNKAGSTPTETTKAFYNAAKNNDVQTMRSLMSKDTVAAMEKFAKAENKSLDDFLKDENKSDPPPDTLETRNEKIEGDKATLEVKDKKSGWETLHFVKEDGQWKLRGPGGAD
ncbi:MAG: DUF4878 domain-containing protein [Acidobacteriota bacterium]|nr:DUF4878 domain-containing protein [Acidobacteriota bacterium]